MIILIDVFIWSLIIHTDGSLQAAAINKHGRGYERLQKLLHNKHWGFMFTFVSALTHTVRIRPTSEI